MSRDEHPNQTEAFPRLVQPKAGKLPPPRPSSKPAPMRDAPEGYGLNDIVRTTTLYEHRECGDKVHAGFIVDFKDGSRWQRKYGEWTRMWGASR